MTLPVAFREAMVLPAVVAPMFLVSGIDLAIASCTAGIAGTLTRNHCRSDEEFAGQLDAVGDALARLRDAEPDRAIGPLFVNVSLGRTRGEIQATLAICRARGIGTIITAGGDPRWIVEEAAGWGCAIFHDVTSLRFAEKALAAGVAGMIAIGAGGGGHSGTVSHLALIPAIRAMFDGTIIMAGAVATGGAIRAAEVLGADLAYLGTRFIATQESLAAPAYKALLVDEMPADLVYSGFTNGVPAMWLKTSIRQLGLDPEALPAFRSDRSHLPPDVKPWSNLWSAGQGIAVIDDIPSVATLVDRLHAEYAAACAVPAFGAGGGRGDG